LEAPLLLAPCTLDFGKSLDVYSAMGKTGLSQNIRGEIGDLRFVTCLGQRPLEVTTFRKKAKTEEGSLPNGSEPGAKRSEGKLERTDCCLQTNKLKLGIRKNHLEGQTLCEELLPDKRVDQKSTNT